MNPVTRSERLIPLSQSPLHLVLPLVFLAGMFFFHPFRQIFEMGKDEGGQVMKALLLARGYSLYSEIWSDQPPVLTYLQAAGIRAFNADVDDARVLVMLLSTALLAAAAHTLRLNWGLGHALFGVVLITLLPFFTTLSAAVMVGLPAISLAVVALAAHVAWHRQRKELYLVLSAFFLALSIFTKLFTVILAPIFALGLLLDERARLGKSIAWRDLLRPALVWSLFFAAFSLAAVLLMIGPANLGQLLFTHLNARDMVLVNLPISWWLRDSWPILLLAGVGSLFTILERRWLSLYLIAWVVSAYLLLTVHRPVFYHHQLLVTVPAAMLAGIAAGEAFRWIPRMIRSRLFLNERTLLSVLALAGFAASLALRLPLTLPDFYRAPQFQKKAANSTWPEQQQMFLTKMANHAPETHWIVTDLPMYAFRAGLVNPPYLSFITAKRLYTGELTEEKIIAVIAQYRPEQVMIGRREFPMVKAYLQADYRLLYDRGKRYLYLRKDLKGR